MQDSIILSEDQVPKFKAALTEMNKNGYSVDFTEEKQGNNTKIIFGESWADLIFMLGQKFQKQYQTEEVNELKEALKWTLTFVTHLRYDEQKEMKAKIFKLVCGLSASLKSGDRIHVLEYGDGVVTGWVGYPPDKIRVQFDSGNVWDFHPIKLDEKLTAVYHP